MKELIKESVMNLKPYKVTKQNYRIKIDANESPYNIFEDIGSLVLSRLSEQDLNRYPDNDAAGLKKTLAEYVGVEEESILCGNGSDELLKIIIDTFVDKEDVVVTHSPSFAMYKVMTGIAGGKLIEVQGNEDFSIDINAIISKANKNKAKVIFLCTPNNPTGRIVDREDIIRVLDNTSSIVVVDEAYFEFFGETIIDKIKDYEKLIVLRTLSKAFGLAGLRIGYVAANKELIEIISRVKAPYNLNSISQYIGERVLDNKEIAFKYIEKLKYERDKLFIELEKIKGVQAIPSNSNFILIRVSKYQYLTKRFREEKINIKGFGTEGLLKNCIRLTVGTDRENIEVLRILKEV